MYCSKCGANVADGTAFCSACGQPMVGFSVGQAATPPASAPPAAPGGTVYAPPAQAGWQAPAALPVAYAGFWLRFVAWIIDGSPLLRCDDPVSSVWSFDGHARNDDGDARPMCNHYSDIRQYADLCCFHGSPGSTTPCWKVPPGRARSAKKRLVWKSRTRRQPHQLWSRHGPLLCELISDIILFIGYIMAGFTEKKQALHDILAGTLVIRKL